MKLTSLVLFGICISMLKRSALGPRNISRVNMKQKKDFYLSIGLPRDLFDNATSVSFQYGKKDNYSPNFDGSTIRNLLCNHTNKVIAQQLQFGLKVRKQFQSSLFWSEEIKSFSHGD